MTENMKWLLCCPSCDANFKTHLKEASVDELKDALSLATGKSRIVAIERELKRR